MQEPKKNSPFLSLPAELRNRVYSYVFAPSDQVGLFPSPETLETVSFLYTCRQIHAEAHVLAYASIYSVTNRWHRSDLALMAAGFENLPDMFSCPITSLSLAAQWRLPHKSKDTGSMQFFDGYVDWAWWIWDCLELFPSVTHLQIMHDRQQMTPMMHFTHHLVSCLQNTPEHRPWGNELLEKHLEEPSKWRLTTWKDIEEKGSDTGTSRLVLIGLKERHGRRVEINRLHTQKQDLAEYMEARWQSSLKVVLGRRTQTRAMDC